MKKEFSFSLFDLDWEVFSVNIEGAVNRVPVIEQTGIKSTVCGPGRLHSFYFFTRLFIQHRKEICWSRDSWAIEKHL